METIEQQGNHLVIDLSEQGFAQENIQFLRAETSSQYCLPFATVYYSMDGKEQENGLRLDMDKQIFLDHFDDGRENIVHNKQTIIRISEYISQTRSEFLGV